MHLVCPLAALDCRLSGIRWNDPGHAQALGEQVRYESMLLKQSLTIAHRSMMTLDENVAAVRCHQARC